MSCYNGELLCCGTLSPDQTSRTKPSPATSINHQRKDSASTDTRLRTKISSSPSSVFICVHLWLNRELCQRAMKPPDPCACIPSNPPHSRSRFDAELQSSHFIWKPNFGLHTSHLSTARLVPQWLLRIPRSVITSYAARRPVPPPAYEPRRKHPTHPQILF